MEFKAYLQTESANDIVSSLKNFVASITPASITSTLRQFKATTIDDLLVALKNNAQVKKVMQLCSSASSKNKQVEEGIGSMLLSGVKVVLDKLVSSIVATIKHVFAPFASDAGFVKKAVYAGQLLLTFLLAPFLLALGAPMSGVIGFPIAMSVSWWLLEWFGLNFIFPAVRAVDGF